MNDIQLLASDSNRNLPATRPEPEVNALTMAESEIVRAAEGKRLGALSASARNALASSLYLWSKSRLGHTSQDPNEKNEVVAQLANDFNEFPALTEAEVWLAAKKGLAGEYGNELLIFSPNNLYRWLKRYIEQSKQPVMKKYVLLAAKSQVKPEPDPITQLRMVRDGLVSKIREQLPIEDLGNAYHDFLETIGVTMYSEQEKKQVWKESLSRVRAYSEEETGMESAMRKELSSFVAALEDRSVQLKNPNENYYVRQAIILSKKILFNQFIGQASDQPDFDLIAHIDQHLETYIQNQPNS